MNVETALKVVSGDRGEKIRAFHKEHLDRFNTMPGSGHNHQAWPGGFRVHMDQCMNLAYHIVDLFADQYFDLLEHGFEDDLDIPETENDSVFVVLYFHDVEKLFRGTDFDKWVFLKETLPAKWGIVLTPEELDAIKYVHGEGDDYRKDKRVMSRLAAICHMADIGSARVLFDIGKPKG